MAAGFTVKKYYKIELLDGNVVYAEGTENAISTCKEMIINIENTIETKSKEKEHLLSIIQDITKVN